MLKACYLRHKFKSLQDHLLQVKILSSGFQPLIYPEYVFSLDLEALLATIVTIQPPITHHEYVMRFAYDTALVYPQLKKASYYKDCFVVTIWCLNCSLKPL